MCTHCATNNVPDFSTWDSLEWRGPYHPPPHPVVSTALQTAPRGTGSRYPACRLSAMRARARPAATVMAASPLGKEPGRFNPKNTMQGERRLFSSQLTNQPTFFSHAIETLQPIFHLIFAEYMSYLLEDVCEFRQITLTYDNSLEYPAIPTKLWNVDIRKIHPMIFAQ